MSKGTILYLVFRGTGTMDETRVAELQRAGYNVLTFNYIHEAFPVIEESIVHGQKIDLIVVETLTAMIHQDSRDLYERLRQTRFHDLPALFSGFAMSQGQFVINFLNALMPNTCIMILASCSKGTGFGTRTAKLFEENQNIVCLFNKAAGIDEFTRSVGRAFIEAQKRSAAPTS